MKKNSITVHSPGRINIIGEHTDYNDGLVLPAAIDMGTTFQITKNQTKHSVNVLALNLDESLSFELDNDNIIETGWKNYVIGVVMELQKLGCKLEGFDAEFRGDVPIGSGMSSSAALECSLAFGLNAFFELNLDNWQLIKACQMAEHNYVGTKCGIMDQFASVMGKANQVMLLNCKSLEYQYFPCELGYYEFILLNSNVSHSLASSEYNTRRAECQKGLIILNNNQNRFESLSDVDLETLVENKEKMDLKIFNRCHHIISENKRVRAATDALKIKDFSTLGRLMYKSHYSLQHHYEVSCPELDFLVDSTKESPYILGSRMMGGGFGGCTINLIRKDRILDFVSDVSKKYHNKFGVDLTHYQVNIGDGARIIS